jgi:2-amino-4-hydroxy-6-hydroxymethyldihydropteridine diphosphokinase
MTQAFISVGSNIDPEDNVKKALNLIRARSTLINISTIYYNEAEGRPEQPPYYNCVVQIETDLSPLDVKFLLLRPIEEELGRQRTADKYAPRTIDLDLIIYDRLAMVTDDFILPEPDILWRTYLAVPLLELAPDMVLPGLGLRLDEVTAVLPQDKMKKLDDYTEFLRKEIGYGCKH